MSAADRTPTIRRRFVLRMFPAIILPMFISIADQTMIATALPAIATDFGDVELVAWTVAAYLMAAAIVTPIYGRLGDLTGRRRMLTIALCVVLVGSLICTTAPNIYVLILGRFIQGLGGGGLMALSMALVSTLIPARERGKYQGYLSAVNIAASTLAPLIGGIMTEHFGWRYLMALTAPLTLFALIFSRRMLDPDPPPQADRRMDIVGILLFSGFVLPFVIATNELRASGAESLAIGAVCAVIAAVSLVLLFRAERRIKVPLFPLDMLLKPGFSRCAVVAFCHGAAMLGAVTLTPLYLRIEHGLVPTQTAAYLMTLTIGLSISAIVTGQLVTRTGRVAIFPSLGMTILIPVVILFAIFGKSFEGVGLAMWYAAIALCFGTVMGVLQQAVQVAAGPAHYGAAAATLQMSRTLGAATGASVTMAVYFVVLRWQGVDANAVLAALEGPDVALQGGISAAFTGAHCAIAAFAVVGAIMAWRMPLRRLD